MSVHPYTTADGTRYQVRWREGQRVRTRSWSTRRDAVAFEIDVKARKQKGEAMPQTGRRTLAAAYDEWWSYHASTLAKSTQDNYKAVWDAHVKNRFDHHRLGEWVANPQLFDELTADMRSRGVGNASQRKVLVVMSSVFARAVEWKKVGINPVLTARKPKGSRKYIPHPFPPIVVERVRLKMLRRATKDDTGMRALGDACFVTLMSYAGLRPGEALALTWDDIGARTIAIDKAVSYGEEGSTKTGGVRSIPLVKSLADDLSALRLKRRHAKFFFDDDQLLFPGRDGAHWSRSQYNNWRTRVWKPVMADLAGGKPPQPRLAASRPYDCRGSFVSLQLRAGVSPLEVASWAGHSPQVMFAHYANVIEELKGEPTISPEEQIRRARRVVETIGKLDLDRLVADVMESPTIGEGGTATVEERNAALDAATWRADARLLFDPEREL